MSHKNNGDESAKKHFDRTSKSALPTFDQLESELDIRPRVLEIGRRSAKLDIEVYIENTIVSKSYCGVSSNGTFLESRKKNVYQSEIITEIKNMIESSSIVINALTQMR